MKLFKIFGKDNNENRFIDDGKKDEPIVSRRRFLQTGAFVAGAALIKSIPFSDLIEKLGSEDDHEDEQERHQIDLDERWSGDEEQLEDFEEERLSTKELLDFKKEGDVILTPETLKSVENYWEKVHSTKGNKLYTSLEKGYNEIGEYKEELKKIFVSVGVPEKFLYLAIAESYWKLDAISPAKARGPYQFMKETAKKYGLYSDKEKFDYRTDPFESARAAAELLKDLYQVSGDWDLALSGYNGGFIWKYLKENRGSGDKPSYENFLKYLEKKINYVRNEAKHSKFHENYRLRSTLGSLAKWTGLSVSDIADANGIKNPNKVKKGMIIKIPLLNDDAREWSYNKKISGFSENLNYPAKFNGIYSAIENAVVTKQKKAGDFSTHITENKYIGRKIERKRKSKQYFEYTVKQSEGWYRIHKNVENLTDASEKEIMLYNEKISKRGLRSGDKLKIPKKKRT